MAKKQPMNVHVKYMRRPGSPPVSEVKRDEKSNLTIIETNDGPELTSEDEEGKIKFIGDLLELALKADKEIEEAIKSDMD